VSCLSALYESISKVKNRTIEVLVTTHEKSLAHKDILDLNSTTRLITLDGECPLNSSQARNLGIINSNGLYLAFTDADCKVDIEWVDKLFVISERISSKNDIACVLGTHWLDQKYDFWSDLQERFREHHARRHIIETEEGAFTDRLDGRNLLIKGSIARKFLFNESLIREADRELGCRLVKANYKILYFEDLKVYHKPITFLDIINKQFMYGVGSAAWRKKQLNRTFLNYYWKQLFFRPIKHFLKCEISLMLLFSTLFNNAVYQLGRIYSMARK